MEKIKVKRRSGRAEGIEVGADGTVWVVGTNKMSGGFGIWRRADGIWKPINSNSNGAKTWRGAVRLAVGPTGLACFVRNNGAIGCFTSDYKVRRMKGIGKDIAIGADGSMFVLGGKAHVDGGWSVWKWQAAKWVKVPGRSGTRIAADPQGNPWIVDDQGTMWRHRDGQWSRVKGKAKAIAIGPEGSVLSLGTRATTGGHRLFKWSHQTEQWTLVGSGVH